MMASTDIVQRATARELVDCYHQAVADMTEAFRLLQSAQKSLDARFRLGDHYSSITVTTDGNHVPALQIAKALARLERDAWNNIVDRIDIKRMMPTAKVKLLESQIENNQMAPLSMDSVKQLVDQCMETLPTLRDELIAEVFDWLRPQEQTDAAAYKRNEREVVGKRVILTSAIKRNGVGCFAKYMVCSHMDQRLTCLENVFLALDGKGTVHRGYYAAITNAINESRDGSGATTYFAFKSHKNGNLHLEFLRDDLLAEFNRRAGGMNLKKGATT